MAAGRNNLTRRAVLGAAFAVPAFVDGTAMAVPGANRGRWECAFAALRRAEAAKEAFYVRCMAPADRAYEAVRARWPRGHDFDADPRAHATLRTAFDAYSLIEERLNDHESARLDAIHRLLRVPAPDPEALATKLAIAIDCEVWESDEGERCLASIRADAWQFAGNGKTGPKALQLRNDERGRAAKSGELC